MKRSNQRILTSHVGSLPRPPELLDLYRNEVNADTFNTSLPSLIESIVRRQADIGIDIVNDGEFGKPSRASVDYAAWWTYVYDRISGYEIQETRPDGNDALSFGSRDRAEFRQFYEEELGLGTSQHKTIGAGRVAQLTCVGPVQYTGHELIQRDIANLKAALNGVKVEEAFMTAVSPATLQILPNEFYSDSRDYVWALAGAIRQEYRAIVDAGFILQVDDPALVDLYDWWFSLDKGVAEYRAWAELQVEALNYALEGIPEDQVRFHVCWGSWHGPHSTDVPLKDIVDLLLKINTQAYVIEAANARHEHEWKVWRDVARLPEGKILIPGVVSHATNVLEHPELVCDRIVQFASIVGRENVIAGTDCGLGGRIHPQLAWAKLHVLRQGADLATRQLW